MGKSSKDKRDIYYRLAKEQGWRARSAFKLIQVDETFHLLDGVTRVVDLCAAPGSWSQVLSNRLSGIEDALIVAVDLQPMASLPGVIQIQGDITRYETAQQILSHFTRTEKLFAQLVICDGAPDVTGLHDLDEYIQSELVYSALTLATNVLETRGNFVAKIFRGRNIHLLLQTLSGYFERVVVSKPASSRNSSIEAFVVCLGFNGKVISMNEDKQGTCINQEELSVPESIEFTACPGEFDSDRTYPLTKPSLEPVQSPMNPPYQTFLSLKRSNFFNK